MIAALRPNRLIASALVAAGLLGLAFLPARTGLGQSPGKGSDAKMPTDLLKAQPFDRITLIDDSSWLVEPVSPRPLPVWDPIKARADQKAKDKQAGRNAAMPKDNVGVAKKDAKPKEEPLSETIDIHLTEGEIRDYRVKRASIKKVDYFEDLLMAEADRLIINKDFAKAFEHYLLVKARNPTWKGLEERVQKLLFEEGSWALVEQDREKDVRLLRELFTRKSDYPNLGDKLATAYGGRIGESFEKGSYPYGRKVLHDLESISPKNPQLREQRDKFVAKAKALSDDGMKKDGADRLEKLTEALRVWPSADGVAEKYEEAFKALPTLDVAVIDLPRPAGPFIRNPAGERVLKLLYLPILANESEDATHGKLANQLATSLEIGDIGRKIDLKLKVGPTWSDGSRQVAAIDVVRALSDRAQPRSPGYSARWADLLARVEITDEQQVTISLNRPILKPEAWLFASAAGAADALGFPAVGRVASALGEAASRPRLDGLMAVWQGASGQ